MSNDEKFFTKTSFNLFGKQNVKISQRKVTTKKKTISLGFCVVAIKAVVASNKKS